MAEEKDVQCGSDEVFIHVCGVCQDDEVLRKAEGYCVNCKEYLCTNCIQHHKSVRITKSHDIIDVGDDIEDIIRQFAGTTVEEDVCQDHGKTPIDMFCRNHNEVGCHLCMTLIHNKCATEPVTAAIRAFKDSQLETEIKELRDILCSLRRTRDENEKVDNKSIKKYKTFLERQKSECHQLMRLIRTNQLEDEKLLVAELNKVLGDSKLKKAAIEDGMNLTGTLLQRSNAVYQAKNAEQKFITSKKLSEQVGLLQSILKDVIAKDTFMMGGNMVGDEFRLVKRKNSNKRSVIDFYKSIDIKVIKIPYRIKFDAPSGKDTLGKNGVTYTIPTRHHCMSAMKHFEDKCLEELRYEWYREFAYINTNMKCPSFNVIDDLKPPATLQSYKLLLLGDWNVGKTTFIRRNISGNLSKVYKESLGMCVYPIALWTTVGQITFDVWDTCGQEHISELRDGIYKEGQCAIIMFDASSTTSVKSVSRWYDIVTKHCGNIPVVVCGNRIDAATPAVKDGNIAKLKELTLTCLSYQLMSGKTMTNFEAPFLPLARALTSNCDMTVTTKCALYPPVDSRLENTASATKENPNNDNDDEL